MPVASWMGTSDTSFTSSGGGGDMVKTDATEYDGSAASTGGNGYTTKRTAYVTGSTTGQRVTTMVYDYRGRVTIVTNPQSPHAMMKYDDLGRTLAVGQYSTAPGSAGDPTSTTTNRLGLSTTAYDERGQVYETVQTEIVQSTGAAAGGSNGAITTANWYDNAGRLAKTAGASISKTEYDRLGRPIVRYVLATTDDSTYAAATGVSAAGTLQTAANIAAGDVVMEESRTGYHATSGRVLMSHSLQRHHDASPTAYGPLDSNADGDPLTVTAANLSGRAQIAVMWYDSLDRMSISAAYGTNGASNFTWSSGGAPGSSSPSVMRTKTEYDDYGNVAQTTDQNGILQVTQYDHAGRRAKVIDNYVNGTPGGGTDNDEDRVVEYVYTNGLVTTVTRKMPSSGDDQATTYVYGTTTSTSGVATGHLRSSVIYPEQSGGQSAGDRTVATTYNAQGQVTSTTDCEGNVIANTYDTGGRITLREVTSFASGFDTRVKKIATTYTNRGQLAMVQQQNSSSVALDEVSNLYDDWGNLKTQDQDPDSSIASPSGHGYHRQTWTSEVNSSGGTGSGGGWQSMITKQWSSGIDNLINYGFAGGGGIDDLLGRTSTMTDGNNVQVASYVYMGARTVLGATLPEPQVTSEMFGSGGSSTYSTYMDAFNRPIKQRWVKTGLTGTYVPPVYVDNAVAYSYTSDVVGVVDSAIKDSSGTPKRLFDQLRAYDNLRRLKKQTEGEATTLGGSITTQARYELYARNLAGKITSDKVTLNSDSDYVDGPTDSLTFGEMDDGRTYNKRNELLTRSVIDTTNPSTPRAVTLTYDKNGNLTSDGEKYTYKYNPWCQLVQVKAIGGGTPVVANFVYNGMGHRTGEQLDTSSSTPGTTDGIVDSNDPWFYMATDLQGRRVVTYRSGDSYSKETFIYHPGQTRGPGITGGILLRDREGTLTDPTNWAGSNAGDTRDERIYACSDFRGNVSALVSAAGTLVEQFRYSATGVPNGMPRGDVNGDGIVAGGGGGADFLKTDAARIAGIGAYSVEMDVNLDGTVTAADVSVVSAASGATTGRGKLSAASVGWRVGWRGMEWNVSIGAQTSPLELYLPGIGVVTASQLACSIPCGTRVRAGRGCTTSGGGCAGIAMAGQWVPPPAPVPIVTPALPVPNPAPQFLPGGPSLVPNVAPNPAPTPTGPNLSPTTVPQNFEPAEVEPGAGERCVHFCKSAFLGILRCCGTAAGAAICVLVFAEEMGPEPPFPPLDPPVDPRRSPECRIAEFWKEYYCSRERSCRPFLNAFPPMPALPGSLPFRLWCDEIKNRRDNAFNCATARRAVTSVCFGGRDDSGRNHSGEEADSDVLGYECDQLMAARGCGN